MDPKNIIVRMPNWVGDFVMATPILTDLRVRFPNARITAMAKQPLCLLLKNDKDVDELFCFQKPVSSFLRRKELRDIVGKLRQGNYDLGILLTNSFSSAWWFWQGKVKMRIGYSSFLRRLLLTHPIARFSSKEHQLNTYKRLLLPLGIPLSATLPRLFLSDEELVETQTLLRQRGYRRGMKLIGIHPGAAYGTAKRWLPQRFREVALRLLEDKDTCVVFIGSIEESHQIKEICQGLPDRAINLAGSTSLRELVSIIQSCSLLLTNDSGPMHIASALKVPLVALFGSTCPDLTGPQSGIVIQKKLCPPCFKRVCPKDFCCMEAISTEEVLEKIHLILSKNRPLA